MADLSERPGDRGKQVGIVHRLGEKVDRPVLHRLGTGPDVAVAGEEDDRQQLAALGERLLQLDAGQLRHRQVEHETARLAVVAGLQECAGRLERGRSPSGRRQQAFGCPQDIGIVVDDVDGCWVHKAN